MRFLPLLVVVLAMPGCVTWEGPRPQDQAEQQVVRLEAALEEGVWLTRGALAYQEQQGRWPQTVTALETFMTSHCADDARHIDWRRLQDVSFSQGADGGLHLEYSVAPADVGTMPARHAVEVQAREIGRGPSSP